MSEEQERTEEDLVDFVDTAAVGLHWVAPDGTILWANPADYEPLGYSRDEYIGRHIAEFHADDEAIEDILDRLAKGERLHNYEARLLCKDGSTREVLITSSVRFDESGEFVHTRCFTSDVSEWEPASAELQVEALTREVERLSLLASRERGLVEGILRHSPHGIIVSDANGKLVLQNEAAERIWAGSASAEGVEGWGKYRAFHPDGRPFEPDEWAMARTLSSGEIVETEEVHFQRFDDTHGVLLGSAAPIIGPDGEIDGALSVFADITELKEKEEELRISSERYLTTLRSIGDAVIATDAEARIRFMNPVAEELTEWTSDEAKGRPLSDVFVIVNEQTRQEVESPADKVIREGRIVGLANHTVLIGRDGTEVAIDDSGAPIFDSNGELAGVVLVFRDVTETRREEARRRFIAEAGTALSSSLDYTATLGKVARLAVPEIADWCAIDIVQDAGPPKRLAVAHVDPDKVQLASDLAERYPPEPDAPYGARAVIRTGEAQVLTEISTELLQQATVDDEHRRLLDELGLVSAMIVPLCCRGRTLGAVTFISAESGRRFQADDLALAEELATMAGWAVDNARLYREARDANRAKDEFLATVSHELRTPLNAILGWANLLRSSEMTEEKQEHAFEVIERNARAQAQLVEDLLDVSRIISGNLRLDMQTIDLGKILASAIDVVGPGAESKGVQVDAIIDEDARPATGDPDRIQQVVWNLLSNAVKFTDRGGKVTVELSRRDSSARIRVSDTGVGIEPDELPTIFDRFKQSMSGSKSHGGLGLGLAIVKHLVELHGGSVGAASPGPGEGSTFEVTLPLAATQTDERPLSSTSHRPIPAVLRDLRILVVDDELDARALIAEMLENHGAEVVCAASAAEGLREIGSNPPDVIVSDIGMPEEDGYSFIGKVRAMERGDRDPIPAAALTAYARMEDRTRAMLAGFQSHIAKPVESKELVIVVAALAGRTGGSWWPRDEAYDLPEE